LFLRDEDLHSRVAGGEGEGEEGREEGGREERGGEEAGVMAEEG
jgi:hypothetical protein